MTPKERKYLIELKGYTQTGIAKKLDVSIVMVHRVLNEQNVSRRIQDYICEVTGKTFEEMWR